jgi:hypothetical protein
MDIYDGDQKTYDDGASPTATLARLACAPNRQGDCNCSSRLQFTRWSRAVTAGWVRGGITSARCLSRSCRVQAGCRSETRVRALASARACASRVGGAPGPGRSAWGCMSASGPRAFDTAGAMPASSPPSVASHRAASAAQARPRADLTRAAAHRQRRHPALPPGQRRGPGGRASQARPQDLGDAADERGGNTAPHIARVHEQIFQLDGVGGLGPGGEAGNRAVLFRDMSAALG